MHKIGGIMLRVIFVILMTLITNVAYGNTVELFCYGNLASSSQDLGNQSFFVSLDMEKMQYEIYLGDSTNIHLAGEFKKSKLFYSEIKTTDQKKVTRYFSLNRVNLKYSLGYQLNKDGLFTSEGVCETYQPKL
jgi:hypothetical protein